MFLDYQRGMFVRVGIGEILQASIWNR